MTKRIGITPGEPAGIGPDLLVELAQQNWNAELVAFCDPDLLKERAKQLKLPIEIEQIDLTKPVKPHQPSILKVVPFNVKEQVKAGVLNKKNSQYVLDTLGFASKQAMNNTIDAIVTGPVHKGIINEAGITFSGHTEFFAEQAKQAKVVMMLMSSSLRVALATTHLPLKDVPKAISKTLLTEVISIIDSELKKKFRINTPTIYVCGLNPHAGEDGHLGREEIDIITPALEELRSSGINLVGPLPADTLFQDKYLNDADAVLAMYHDQGLPVLKYQGFGESINITLGLPYIRTSVDHGTALPLAGTGTANVDSFKCAINSAIELATLHNEK